MRVAFALVLLALLAFSASASVLYARNQPRAGWTKGFPSVGSKMHTFHVAMKQQNLDVLDRIFFEVSDPEHDNYQEFLTTAEIHALTAPSETTVNAITSWLTSAGIPSSHISLVGDNMKVTTSISNIERVFSVKFFECSHPEHKTARNIAFGKVTVPDSVRAHMDFVTGLSNFPNKHAKFAYSHRNQQKVGQDIKENDAVLPQTLQNMYNVPGNLQPGSSKVTSGVIEFDGESFSNDDLYIYSTETGVPINNVSASQIYGPNDPTSPGDESSLDIQVMAGINPTAQNWFWLESGDNWLYSWTLDFLNATTYPQLVSISYGWYEWDQCEEGIGGDECTMYNLTDATFVTRVNTQFQKIGTRGTSIFVASGDSGCHTRYDPTCSLPYLLADFPSSSTYVTSVGATEVSFTGINYNFQAKAPACTDATLNYSCVWTGTETAVDINRAYFSSGGGFSNISQPGDFQAKAISGYLSSGVALPPASYFDANGRGYPDIAANGHNGLFVEFGQVGLIGGTSQSSPFATGIFGLLLDDYLTKTGQPFGWLNPLIYKMWEAQPNTFTDITVGDNKCPEGNTSPCPQCQGFIATAGWDPVTGLGTPNYANIKAYLDAQADKVVARRAQKNRSRKQAKQF